MDTRTLIGTIVVGVVAVVGIIVALQSFDASTVACTAIGEARAELQSLYDAGVAASVQIFSEERTAAEARLNACLGAKSADPCADAQAAQDAAVKGFNDITSPLSVNLTPAHQQSISYKVVVFQEPSFLIFVDIARDTIQRPL